MDQITCIWLTCIKEGIFLYPVVVNRPISTTISICRGSEWCCGWWEYEKRWWEQCLVFGRFLCAHTSITSMDKIITYRKRWQIGSLNAPGCIEWSFLSWMAFGNPLMNPSNDNFFSTATGTIDDGVFLDKNNDVASTTVFGDVESCWSWSSSPPSAWSWRRSSSSNIMATVVGMRFEAFCLGAWEGKIDQLFL